MKISNLIYIFLLQFMVIVGRTQAQDNDIVIDSNCIIEDLGDIVYLDFFSTNTKSGNIKASYPNLMKYKGVGITHLAFYNSNIDNIPRELTEF